MAATYQRLSVVMGNYNDGPLLQRSLPAILEQSAPPLEVVVIDDGSTDGSIDIIHRLATRYPKIRLYRNKENLGIHAVIRRSLEIVDGDFIYWAGADDLVLPGFFERSLSLLAEYPRAAICSALTCVVDENENDCGIYPSPVVLPTPGYLSPAQAARALATVGNWFTGNTAIFRRAEIVSEGGFPDNLHALVDAFLSQVLALRYGACFIPEVLGRWRRDPTTYSSGYGASARIQQETLDRAGVLMRSDRYRGLFPNRFINSWENEMRYGIARLELQSKADSSCTNGIDDSKSTLGWARRILCRFRTHFGRFIIFFRYFPRLAMARRLHRNTPRWLREVMWGF